MKTQLKSISLITAVLVVTFMGVQAAEAKIKVRAKIRTPHVGIQVNTGPSAHRPVVVRRVSTAPRHYVRYEVTKKDRKVAKRLAKFTGASKSELVSLRKQGYRWTEIGAGLDLPRSAVYAAMDSASWKRFLKQDRRYGRRNMDGRRQDRNRTVCVHH